MCGRCAAVAPTASLAEKWDMAMAYSSGNFHTQLGQSFADAVRTATGGEVNITVHGGGSLYKGSEIKRAVQTGQVADWRTDHVRTPERRSDVWR